MFAFTSVPSLAVIISTVVGMVVGFLWYGPLFGKTFTNLMGSRMAEANPNDPMMYVGTAIAWLITSYVLALILMAVGARTVVDGIVGSLVVSLGIAAAQTFIYSTFNAPNRRLWALNAGCIAVSMMIMGAVIALMP